MAQKKAKEEAKETPQEFAHVKPPEWETKEQTPQDFAYEKPAESEEKPKTSRDRIAEEYFVDYDDVKQQMDESDISDELKAKILDPDAILTDEDIAEFEKVFGQLDDDVDDEYYFDGEFNYNKLPMFDVEGYRGAFMALKNEFDELYNQRYSSKKAHDDAWEMFEMLFARVHDDPVVQDFFSYCFKKGQYDFIHANYERQMKMSLLAASNGNAFAAQKLQLFMNVALEELVDFGGKEDIQMEVGLTDENYLLFLTKCLADIMVKDLKIDVSELMKEKNEPSEQSQKSLQLFRESMDHAVDVMMDEIEDCVNHLGSLYEDMIEKNS